MDENYESDDDDFSASGESGCIEVREEVDSDGKVISSEMFDLSKQLDQFQNIVNQSKASGTEKSLKQQELLNKLKECLTMEDKLVKETLDSDSKFMMEIAALSDESSRRMKQSRSEAPSGTDLKFLDDLLGRELDEAEALAAEKYRRLESELKSKTDRAEVSTGWKKGFFSKPEKSTPKSSSPAPPVSRAVAAVAASSSSNDRSQTRVLSTTKSSVEVSSPPKIEAVEEEDWQDKPRPFAEAVVERAQASKLGGSGVSMVTSTSLPPPPTDNTQTRPLSVFAQQRLKLKESKR